MNEVSLHRAEFVILEASKVEGTTREENDKLNNLPHAYGSIQPSTLLHLVALHHRTVHQTVIRHRMM